MTNKDNDKKYSFLLVVIFIFNIILLGLATKLFLERSTLKWVIIPGVLRAYIELCDGRQLYPPYPTSSKGPWIWPFPAFSPDGKYYVDISRNNKSMNRKWIKMYKADTKKEIGRYFSKYKSLIISCWAKDSSGIYIKDYEPSVGIIDIGWSSKTGPVKKLLVPQ